VVKALCAFLAANMPSIQKAYDNWPSPNQTLDMPCLSVFTRSPQFRPTAPYTIWKGAPDATTNQVQYRRVMGQWDFSFQLDLWAPYKPQREILLAELVDAFSLDPQRHGIFVELSDYFDEWVEFVLENPEFVDDEAGSQRNEWRVRTTVRANCRAVREFTGYFMETIENDLTVTDDIEVAADQDNSAIV
jgi:hypothetical protein